jgi:hypothetical protein
MKWICSLMIVFALSACGGATDGDAATDTTSMNQDTNQFNDTSDHINTSSGVQPLDSNKRADTASGGY